MNERMKEWNGSAVEAKILRYGEKTLWYRQSGKTDNQSRNVLSLSVGSNDIKPGVVHI